MLTMMIALSEEASLDAWKRIDPSSPEGLFAQGFLLGALTSEDAAFVRDGVVEASSAWDGDPGLLGEMEYLAAAEGMAEVAGYRLEGGSAGAWVLEELERCCEDYLLHRRAWLSGLG